MALDVLGDSMAIPTFRDDEDYIPIQRIKSDAAKTVASIQVRTDEARFRVRQGDQLQQLLELVVKRKAELSSPGEG